MNYKILCFYWAARPMASVSVNHRETEQEAQQWAAHQKRQGWEVVQIIRIAESGRL